mmetsp:Transcript_3541/g.9969  ORF Transcript_3541/g.9969 Transcript_3541/m.9969 type:complete len:258 (-) Transcript_3541:582-1355(-)
MQVPLQPQQEQEREWELRLSRSMRMLVGQTQNHGRDNDNNADGGKPPSPQHRVAERTRYPSRPNHYRAARTPTRTQTTSRTTSRKQPDRVRNHDRNRNRRPKLLGAPRRRNPEPNERPRPRQRPRRRKRRKRPPRPQPGRSPMAGARRTNWFESCGRTRRRPAIPWGPRPWCCRRHPRPQATLQTRSVPRRRGFKHSLHSCCRARPRMPWSTRPWGISATRAMAAVASRWHRSLPWSPTCSTPRFTAWDSATTRRNT